MHERGAIFNDKHIFRHIRDWTTSFNALLIPVLHAL